MLINTSNPISLGMLCIAQHWFKMIRRKTGGFTAIVIYSILLFLSMSGGFLSAVTIAQNFRVSGEVVSGNIVSLGNGENTVTRATSENLNNLYGVVVGSGDISFSQITEEGVQVTNSGVVNVLVTDVAGNIKFGDAITVNSIDGVGELAKEGSKIIGYAQSSMDSSNGKTVEIQKNGQKISIKIASITVKIGISYFGNQGSESESDESSRNKLFEIADNVADKRVKGLALVIASTIILLASLIAAFLIISSSYASIISVGRNPLSEKKLAKTLMKIILISISIFIIGLLLAYITLRLI